MFDLKELFKYENRFFENSTLRKKLINKCYYDFFVNYFDIAKTHKLFARKYY